MSTIRWLGHDDCHRQEDVGGKAASLSRLASTHQVPPGFAIPSLAAAADALPDSMATAVREAYEQLARACGHPAPAVAVRSSAVDEDGADASFAGQHDTYLNISGVGAVLDAVLRCARSAGSAEALLYREHRGLTLEGVEIAVLVQQLVPADVAAVAFSANPVTGHRDEIMINANWGLGESIVGGNATPDTFVVAKGDMAVSWRDIARKELMTVLCDTGTSDVPVPEALREKPSLDDSDVVRIARMAAALEESAGHPVDVECAIAAGELFLLQCRPITTLG